MVRACTGEVCVRSTRPSSGGSTKKVSCICRAGWSGPKFSASKLNHSASTSGPSATSQPIATNTSAMRSDSVVIGCRAPRGRRSHGSVTSTVSSRRTLASRSASSSAWRAASARVSRPRASRRRSLPGRRLVGRGQRADLPVGQSERAAVAGVREARQLELVEVGSRGDRGQGGVQRRGDHRPDRAGTGPAGGCGVDIRTFQAGESGRPCNGHCGRTESRGARPGPAPTPVSFAASAARPSRGPRKSAPTGRCNVVEHARHLLQQPTAPFLPAPPAARTALAGPPEFGPSPGRELTSTISPTSHAGPS